MYKWFFVILHQVQEVHWLIQFLFKEIVFFQITKMMEQVFVFESLIPAIIGTKMMVLEYCVLDGMMIALKDLKVMVVTAKTVFL